MKFNEAEGVRGALHQNYLADPSTRLPAGLSFSFF